jgi:hypothetical protein
MKRLKLLALTLLALVAPCFAQYQFTALDFPGSNFTTARGINDPMPAGRLLGSISAPMGLGMGYLLSGASFTRIDFPG